jgi:putative ABC transport system ATP-binding protein
MIRVANLTRVYRVGSVEVPALTDVSLAIDDKEVACIMGRSGSGKSTLLRQLGLIDRPTSGKITLDDRDVTALPEAERARIRLTCLGYIFQEFALLAELTAHENVCLPGMMASGGRDFEGRAAELLAAVGLKERMNHRPKELSGGEQQRVAIARAMINKPRFLFADEPCANLDTASSELVMKTLVELNDTLGVTVVFVSHDPNDRQYANRVLYLRDGRMVPEHDQIIQPGARPTGSRGGL